MKLAPLFKPTDALSAATKLALTHPSHFVGVIRARGAYRLIALQPLAAGATLFQLEGERRPRATRYSVQMGENLHLDVSGEHSSEEILDRYFWRFMNHSCDPTAMIRNRDVITLRDITPWTDITFNYNSTEYDMAEPFACHCGSAQCLGDIRGFKHLLSMERERLRPLLAPYLSEILRLAGEPDSK